MKQLEEMTKEKILDKCLLYYKLAWKNSIYQRDYTAEEAQELLDSAPKIFNDVVDERIQRIQNEVLSEYIDFKLKLKEMTNHGFKS